MSNATLTPAERAWVDAAMARIKAIVSTPHPPSLEDEHMRRKMHGAGGPVLVEPK